MSSADSAGDSGDNGELVDKVCTVRINVESLSLRLPVNE